MPGVTSVAIDPAFFRHYVTGQCVPHCPHCPKESDDADRN